MTNLFMTVMALVALGVSFPLERAGAQEGSVEAQMEPEAGKKTEKSGSTAAGAKSNPDSARPASAPAEALREAEAYLQSLKTVKARFLQTAQDGSQFLGTFYLNRPGRLRFEYDAPVKDFIVADGLFIYFYDGQLGEQTNAPIGQTLADFLLRKNINFSDDIKVSEVQRSGGLLRISLVQRKDPEAGTLMLGFTENPMALKKWRVTDATGVVTEIELAKLERNVKLDDRLFVYRDPKILPGRTNQ